MQYVCLKYNWVEPASISSWLVTNLNDQIDEVILAGGAGLMHLIRIYYFLASRGCPDALPAGVIAVDLGFNEASMCAESTREWMLECTERSMFDDSSLQLGLHFQDSEGVLHKTTGPHHCEFLANDMIVADWQWEAMKASPGLNYAEHSIEEDDKENERFLVEWEKANPEEFEDEC